MSRKCKNAILYNLKIHAKGHLYCYQFRRSRRKTKNVFILFFSSTKVLTLKLKKMYKVQYSIREAAKK